MDASPIRTLTIDKPAHPLLPSPQHSPVPPRRVSPLREGPRVRRRGLYLGTDPDGQPCYLHTRHLRTHLQVIGPTGQGKSRLLLFLFQLLCHTNRPIVLIDPKGPLYRAARDWSLTNGFQKRIVLFDLSGTTIPGYNPLRQNSLRIDQQAQWIRESVRSAWDSSGSDFSQTPLLMRQLYLCLFTARAMRLSLMDALDVLRPVSALRQAALQQITDPFVRGALYAFDKMNDRLKIEQASSTISRLEMFLCDEIVRQVICSTHSLDLEQLLAEKKIILMNFGKYQPLLPDTIKLLGRMFFNDLLAHIYKGHGEGEFDEDHPCYVMCDEIQNFATAQVCDCLDEGRGIGCNLILGHQFLQQLANEDKSGYLLHSVMNDARTKIIFGGLDADNLDMFANNLMLQHYHPLRIKHIQKTPIFAPIESVRKVPTWSTSTASNRSATASTSASDSTSHSVEHSVSRGHSLADSVASSGGESESHTHGTNSSSTKSYTRGESSAQSGAATRSRARNTGRTQGYGRGRGRTTSDGSTASYGTHSASGWSRGDGKQSGTNSGEGQSMLPPDPDAWLPGDEVIGISAHTGATEGRSSFSGTSGMSGSSANTAYNQMQATSDHVMENSSFSTMETEGVAETEGWSTGSHNDNGIAHQTGESEAWTRSTNRSATRGKTITNSESTTEGLSDTVGKTCTQGKATTEGETKTNAESMALTPFYEYVREEIETLTFLSPEEQKMLVMQRLANIPKQYFLVMTPDSPDCVVRAPHVPDPVITQRRLAAGLASVYSALPCYTRVEQHGADEVIDVEVRRVPEEQKPQISKPLPSPAPDEELVFWQEETPPIRVSKCQQKS